jgi:hypothetical protein
MSTKLTQETVNAILIADDLALHPVAVIEGIKDGIDGNPLGAASNALSAVDAFLAVAKLAGKRVPGLDWPATALSLESNRQQASEELNTTGKLSDNTCMNLASDLVPESVSLQS